MTFSIRTRCPLPSFEQTRKTITAPSLEKAIERARASYARTHRSTELYFEEFGYWCVWSVDAMGHEQRHVK